MKFAQEGQEVSHLCCKHDAIKQENIPKTTHACMSIFYVYAPAYIPLFIYLHPPFQSAQPSKVCQT